MGADFYHCRLKAISRGDHKAVVASAAYRAGMALQDEKYGTVRDFSRKSDVVDTFTVAPEGAPQWASDITQLWNRVEAHERRKDSILAYEWEVALPNELAPADREAIARSFAGWLVDQYGVGVTIGIHEGRDRGNGLNDHMHVMMTARGINEDGFEPKKYNCFNVRPGTPNPEVDRVREHMADLINEALEDAGSDTRVDHRSFKTRGMDREPTRHLGPAATAYERQGYETERGNINRDIIEARLAWQLEDVQPQITADLEREFSERYGDALPAGLAPETPAALTPEAPATAQQAEARQGAELAAEEGSSEPLQAEPQHHGEPGTPARSTPWGRGWRVLADRARALHGSLYDLFSDESSGGDGHLFGKIAHAGRKVWTGEHHHDGQELAAGVAEAAAIEAARELKPDHGDAEPPPAGTASTKSATWVERVRQSFDAFIHNQRGSVPGVDFSGAPEGDDDAGGWVEDTGGEFAPDDAEPDIDDIEEPDGPDIE